MHACLVLRRENKQALFFVFYLFTNEMRYLLLLLSCSSTTKDYFCIYSRTSVSRGSAPTVSRIHGLKILKIINGGKKETIRNTHFHAVITKSRVLYKSQISRLSTFFCIHGGRGECNHPLKILQSYCTLQNYHSCHMVALLKSSIRMGFPLSDQSATLTILIVSAFVVCPPVLHRDMLSKLLKPEQNPPWPCLDHETAIYQ